MVPPQTPAAPRGWLDLQGPWFLVSIAVSALSPILSINLIKKITADSHRAVRVPIALFLVLLHVSDFSIFVMAVQSEPHVTIKYPATVLSPLVVVICACCSLVVASVISLTEGLNITGIYTFSVLGMASIFVLRLGLAARWRSPAGGVLAVVYLAANVFKAVAVGDMAKAANMRKVKDE
jgi:hypothetical protein